MITDLGVGGAQRSLERLVGGTDPSLFNGSVVSLLPRGPQADAIERQGWLLRSLDMTPGRALVSGVPLLRRLLRQERPDIVQTWMYHADLVGGLAARSAGCDRVAWNLRASVDATTDRKWATRSVIHMCAAMSRWVPRMIVCGSRAARASHAALGYPEAKLRVIENGVEIPIPTSGERVSVRRELSIAEDAILIGRIARYHAMKDYRTFLDAAATLVEQGFDAQFLLCGTDVDEGNGELMDQVRSLGLVERCHLLGPRTDIARLNASLDVACSSSAWGEGFPNVIAEAMAAGVPCVATDVGDSAILIGDTGLVVAPRSPSDLAHALESLIVAGPDNRRRMGNAACRRVATRFSPEAMVLAYEGLYRELMEHVRD